MKLVIIAGGKGTRLGYKKIPKPMTKIGGKPVLEHQIQLAKKHGVTEVFILSGHLSHVIIKHFSPDRKLGVTINHLVEPKPFGTAGCLLQLKSHLKKTERFLLFSGDIMMDFNIKRLIDFDSKSNSVGTIVVRDNGHLHDSDLLRIDTSHQIVPFAINKHRRASEKKLAVAAIGIFSAKILDHIPADRPSDLWKEVLPKLIKLNESLFAYECREYLLDMGTPKRLRKVRRDFKICHLVEQKYKHAS